MTIKKRLIAFGIIVLAGFILWGLYALSMHAMTFGTKTTTIFFGILGAFLFAEITFAGTLAIAKVVLKDISDK